MWWRANISARDSTSLNATSISCSDTCGRILTTLRSTRSAEAGSVSRSMRVSRSMSSAAFLKRSYSCRRRTSSARGSSSSCPSSARPRQQHARLDLREHRGHQQVLARQLQLQVGHQLDVLHVLARDLGDRDVEDVEVLLADQVQQQVERTLERLQEHLQRIGRDVEIARQLGHRLAFDDGERHLRLLRRRFGDECLGLELRAGVLDELQFRLHR